MPSQGHALRRLTPLSRLALLLCVIAAIRILSFKQPASLGDCSEITTQQGKRQLLQQHLSHAEWLVSKGKANEAERELKEVLHSCPSSYLAHNDLGAIYIGQKKFGQACREFGQAVALNPSLASIQENLGICLLKSGEVARAAPPLERGGR